jgi:signal transduction histidine kinase/CheY-like chemotaxis protein
MSWLDNLLSLRWLRGSADDIDFPPEGGDQPPASAAAPPPAGAVWGSAAAADPARAPAGSDPLPSTELDSLRHRLDLASNTAAPSDDLALVASPPPAGAPIGDRAGAAAPSASLALESTAAAAVEPIASTRPTNPAAAMPMPAKEASVLVVDDQASNRELLIGYLASLPCTVREAVDGESALIAVSEAPPDLILLDVMMPGLNGYAVTQRLKTDPRTATIPVVLVTSLAETADRLKGLASGADEFLTKPVDRAELVTRVRTLLRLKRLRDERQAVGDLSQRALSGVELSVLMKEAATLLANTLRVDYSAVWEIVAPGSSLLLRAGVGWSEGRVGQATVGAEADSQMGYTLLSRVPVVVEDLRSDTRFGGPQVLHDHEVTSGISVVVEGRDRRLGVVSVHSREGRAFTKDDIYFVEAIAQVLATAIIRKRAEAERAQALLREQAARQRLEESNRALARATQAKSEFLAAMSHELRTPLNCIIGFSELLRDDPADDPGAARRRHFMNNINESGRHLLNLVNDILDLAKVEAGRMKLHPTDFELSTTLQAVAGAIIPLAEKKGLTLETHPAPEAITIWADERKFRQVLYNLLSNAVKFTPEGGQVTMTVRLVDDLVEVTVADTGVGISPEEQKSLFEPFQQLGSSATRDEGTGLGLALTRRLVELQGGRIWVESTPAEGSRFAFTIPLRVAAEHDDTETRELLPDLEGVVLAGLDAPWLTASPRGAGAPGDSRAQDGERPAAIAAEAVAAPAPSAALDAGSVRSA